MIPIPQLNIAIFGSFLTSDPPIQPLKKNPLSVQGTAAPGIGGMAWQVSASRGEWRDQLPDRDPP